MQTWPMSSKGPNSDSSVLVSSIVRAKDVDLRASRMLSKHKGESTGILLIEEQEAAQKYFETCW